MSELLELLELLSESEELPGPWPCWSAPLGFLEVDSRAAERSWLDRHRECLLHFKAPTPRSTGPTLYGERGVSKVDTVHFVQSP